MKRHLLFFVLMALGSVVSVGKLAVLAAIFTPTDFTHYAAVFALVGMAASVISFGLTDGTVKKFVRLIEFGRLEEMRAALDADSRVLLLRHLLALVPAAVVAWIALGVDGIVPAAAVVVLAFAANCFTVVSSLFHGFHRLIGLASSTLARAVSALVFVSVVGYLAGWQAGFLAEAVSAVVVGLLYLAYLRGKLRDALARPASPTTDDQFVSGNRDGLWLFLASTAALVPVSFDRLWVAHFSPGAAAAQYAFAGIWVGAAFTITSIYIQKFGPDAVRARASGARHSLLRSALIHSTAVAVLIAVGSILSFAAIYLFLFEIYWQKYELSAGFVAIATLVAAVQVNRIFDWALIPLDGEQGVFASAVVFAVAAAILFSLCTILRLGIEGYLFSIGAARVAQIMVASVWIARLERASGALQG